MRSPFFILLFLLLLFIRAKAQNDNIKSLKQKLAAAKQDTTRVKTLYNLAYAYTFSYPDTAESYAQQGIQLARKIGYKRGEANCLSVLALSSTFSGNYTGALGYGLKALPIFKDLMDTTMMLWANIQIMNCYSLLEDYDQSLEYGYKANNLLRMSRPEFSKTDSHQIAVAYNLISSNHEKKNRLDSALYYVQKALAWDNAWDDVYQTKGEIYARMGSNDSALFYYRRGVAFAAKESRTVALIDLYNSMSKVFESSGRTDSSIYYANKSVRQAGVQVIPVGLLQASLQLAKLYELQGKPDSAINYLKLAHSLKDSLYSRKKTREAQSFAFNEKLRLQEQSAQTQQEKNRIKIVALLVVILLILLIAFFLWRNNRQKQKANALLQRQRRETEQQKVKAEKALEELKATQAQLVQREKMASLGELTAGIAHEIQNPLNFVNNFSEVNTELIAELKNEVRSGNAEEAIALSNNIEDNEQKIAHHGKRADAIVKGMLQHSRTSTGTKELTDINALTDEYLRLTYHGIRAKNKEFNAQLQTDFDQSIGKVNVVPQDIGRVLINLYNNAFYAVQQKKAEQNGTYEPAVSVSTKKANGRVEISVRDNGNGISQKVLDKIYQPFFTTKPTGEGTGLGLSLSYDIITKVHGGEINVETKEGEYTEFVIWLPS